MIKITVAPSIRNFILLFIFALIILAIAIPNFEEVQFRSTVARASMDMHRVGEALEAYFIDHHAYPRAIPLRNFANDPSADSMKISMAAGLDATITTLEKFGGLHLLAVDPGLTTHGVAGLTTPVAYLDKLPPDPFLNGLHAASPPETKIPFAYYVYNDIPDPGWILISPGPDGDYDLVNPPEIYDPARKLISKKMRPIRYNPAYGTISNGDIFKIKPAHMAQVWVWNH